MKKLPPVVCSVCERDIAFDATWVFFEDKIFCSHHVPQNRKVMIFSKLKGGEIALYSLRRKTSDAVTSLVKRSIETSKITAC